MTKQHTDFSARLDDLRRASLVAEHERVYEQGGSDERQDHLQQAPDYETEHVFVLHGTGVDGCLVDSGPKWVYAAMASPTCTSMVSLTW